MQSLVRSLAADLLPWKTSASRDAAFFAKHKYLVVRSILPRPLLDFLHVYYPILQANGRFFNDDQCPASLALSGDPALDAILEWLRPSVSRTIGADLRPTYSYSRIYAKGDVLEAHLDRDACEISVSITIYVPPGSRRSTLFLRAPDGSVAGIDLPEGDGCIYVGTELEHWRDAMPSDGQIQLFLHYIRTGGKYFPNSVFDGRKTLGGAGS